LEARDETNRGAGSVAAEVVEQELCGDPVVLDGAEVAENERS
jgi:non-ribosomal peptide synthetase component E (peptide arylation enzyme)